MRLDKQLWKSVTEYFILIQTIHGLFHSFVSLIQHILFQQQHDGDAQQLVLVESSKGNTTVLLHVIFAREEDKKHWKILIRKELLFSS